MGRRSKRPRASIWFFLKNLTLDPDAFAELEELLHGMSSNGRDWRWCFSVKPRLFLRTFANARGSFHSLQLRQTWKYVVHF